MKIAHVTATFPPYWGGTGNVAYHNARILHQRGHQVTVFTARTSKDCDNDSEMHFPFTVRRFRPLFRVGNAPFIPGLFKELKGFDLIHLHYPFIFGAELTAAAAKRQGIPLIVTYHQDLLARGVRGFIFRLYSRLNQAWILGWADKLIATSLDYAQNSLLRRIAPDLKSVSAVPNGVDTETFQPETDFTPIWPMYFDISANSPVVLFVGALDRAHYFKGIEVLLTAFAQVLKAHLVIVGNGDLRTHYEGMVESERIHFAGSVNLQKLITFYQGACVTVLPSTTRGEAFGLVLAESMACGTPVIASNLPGVRTLVKNGVNGYLVEPGNPNILAQALNELVENPERAQVMGQAGCALIGAKYSWDKVVERLERLYYDVIHEARAA